MKDVINQNTTNEKLIIITAIRDTFRAEQESCQPLNMVIPFITQGMCKSEISAKRGREVGVPRMWKEMNPLHRTQHVKYQGIPGK